ncbi:hypothetical protein FA95DRAFT_1607592 [Auriscalpium vulgare]|uniref:Uncharacterized protein n=1 Tax=Auriscalpium vulgare TaxID=40419 RepID=A0ACB8RNR4_9AGAM|nr:hypothetical protein FA95DRAFT_1607592 [Auriscalpium vulgare]
MLRPTTTRSPHAPPNLNYTDEERAEDHNAIPHAKRLAAACASSNARADPASDAVQVVVNEAVEPEPDISGIIATSYSTSLRERQPSFLNFFPVPFTGTRPLQGAAETADGAHALTTLCPQSQRTPASSQSPQRSEQALSSYTAELEARIAKRLAKLVEQLPQSLCYARSQFASLHVHISPPPIIHGMYLHILQATRD